MMIIFLVTLMIGMGRIETSLIAMFALLKDSYYY